MHVKKRHLRKKSAHKPPRLARIFGQSPNTALHEQKRHETAHKKTREINAPENQCPTRSVICSRHS